MSVSPAQQPAEGKGTLLGHPKGLFILFFAEMWERFSYYGMRALLVLYLTKHFLMSDGESGMVYGAYTSLVYITPVIGGYLADHYLGQRKAVLFGGILIAVGHILLGVEGDGGQGGFAMNMFWLALAFIIVGTGFLKANISAIVGQLYPRDDMRRDPAYTIFYMGINVGGMMGPIICGILGETVGWSWGFGAAAIGMIAGIIVFVLGKPLLLGKGEPAEPEKLTAPLAGPVSVEWGIYILSVASVFGVAWLVQNHDAVGWLLILCGAGAVLYLLWEAFGRMGKIDRDRMLAALFLLALNPLFWALFEQAGSSLNLFTDRHVDRHFLGWEVPASAFQSINSMFIILLAPLFAALWVMLARRGLEPSTPAKFGLALVQVGLGFLALVAGAYWAGVDNATPAIFIFLLYLLHTMGELCLSPVGLSAMSKLALPRMLGLMMGVWFLATAAGDFIAGMIAANIGNRAEGATDPNLVTLSVYQSVGLWGIGIGVVVLLLAPFVKRLMHLDKLAD
ncbi:POT family proton-dependent oligopeptide transporter [Sphingobium jiangsuense]|uniref:POT family proton-dependent oligopeptide transporter n=1 Tax=Sphingobium jiangsuense TaxID=870476 RepID=A0A7W6FQG6_9SPHN|nr:peptide MFS transporter [Sphingobium jiangsuense]MBB3927116.1 POT family proton-dependent oligopeptide transporter [Sphingobium jiangsuense]